MKPTRAQDDCSFSVVQQPWTVVVEAGASAEMNCTLVPPKPLKNPDIVSVWYSRRIGNDMSGMEKITETDRLKGRFKLTWMGNVSSSTLHIHNLKENDMAIYHCRFFIFLFNPPCILDGNGTRLSITESSTPENTTQHKPNEIADEMPLYWNILLVVITVVILTMAFLVCWHKGRRGLASAIRQMSSTLREGDSTDSTPPKMEGSPPEPGEIMYADLSFQTRMQKKTEAASYRIKETVGVEYAELRYSQQHKVYHN
ncbi:unnamed protein product [Lepidochelys olivacea]